MKTLFVFIALLVSTFSYATCHNFSGNYLHRDSNRPLDVEQTGCESIILDYRNGEREPILLDNVKRMTFEDTSMTAYLSASFSAFDVITLLYEKVYSRPAGMEKTEVRLRPSSWNGKQLLVKDAGYYFNGRFVSSWSEYYVKQ